MLYVIFLLRALAFARKKSFTPENARAGTENKETEVVRLCDFITDWHTTDTETVPLNKQKE